MSLICVTHVNPNSLARGRERRVEGEQQRQKKVANLDVVEGPAAEKLDLGLGLSDRHCKRRKLVLRSREGGCCLGKERKREIGAMAAVFTPSSSNPNRPDGQSRLHFLRGCPLLAGFIDGPYAALYIDG
jgi:hypothetical protein